MTDINQRLEAMNERLKALGVRSISFTWAPEARSKRADELANALLNNLNAFLEGNFTPASIDPITETHKEQ